MNRERNKETRDMMKRITSRVQGLRTAKSNVSMFRLSNDEKQQNVAYFQLAFYFENI